MTPPYGSRLYNWILGYIWYNASSGKRNATKIEWRRQFVEHFDSKYSWSSSKVPIGATIWNILGGGWKQVAANSWRVDSDTWATLEAHPYIAITIRFIVQQHLQNGSWKNASSHPHGKGLELGNPDLSILRKAKRSLN